MLDLWGPSQIRCQGAWFLNSVSLDILRIVGRTLDLDTLDSHFLDIARLYPKHAEVHWAPAQIHLGPFLNCCSPWPIYIVTVVVSVPATIVVSRISAAAICAQRHGSRDFSYCTILWSHVHFISSSCRYTEVEFSVVSHYVTLQYPMVMSWNPKSVSCTWGIVWLLNSTYCKSCPGQWMRGTGHGKWVLNRLE